MSDVTTALAILVTSQEEVDKINGIRADHDRAYSRWMPHINFLFPFVPVEEFDEYQKKLQEALSGFGSFDLVLDQVGHFKQRKAATFNLQPSDDSKLQELFNAVRAAIPEVQPKHPEFHPHLTIGQFKKFQIADKETELAQWLGDGVKVRIDGVYMINRSKEDRDVPFSVNRMISLN